VAKDKLLFDPKSIGGPAKRVLVSDDPSEFRSALGKVGQQVLSSLADGPKYPAEIARALGVHHQSVYLQVRRLEKEGLIVRVNSEVIRGGEANRFALASDGYAVEFAVKGEQMPSLRSSTRSQAFGRFFAEFFDEGKLDGWVVVGSPLPHGPNGAQARDGHYAVQLGFALGHFVSLPDPFPVKLDVDVKAERSENSNLIVVGGPRTNLIAEELNSHLSLKFRQAGFWGAIADDQGRTFSSELDCLVAKVRNPWDGTKTCVLVAGLGGAGTKAGIIGVCNHADTLFQRYRSGGFACVLRGVDRSGDGKVDSVEVLRQL